jgi:uncharacterized protein YidB (DUF937 family)
MSILSQLEGDVGSYLVAHQADLGGLFQDALASAGGYQGILAKLNQAGLGQQVDSWLATSGKNLPVTPQQIEAALGNQHLQALAKSLGVPVDEVGSILAGHLPAAVDQASPNGTIQKLPR